MAAIRSEQNMPAREMLAPPSARPPAGHREVSLVVDDVPKTGRRSDLAETEQHARCEPPPRPSHRSLRCGLDYFPFSRGRREQHKLVTDDLV